MSVLEVADQVADGEATRRVPLGHRVVATLEAASSTLNTDRTRRHTSIHLQGIDNAEIIDAVHARRAPMVPVSATLRL
jgi:hypothetical protein